MPARAIAARRAPSLSRLGLAARLALASTAIACLAALTVAAAGLWPLVGGTDRMPRSTASAQVHASAIRAVSGGQSEAVSPSQPRGAQARPWLGVRVQDQVIHVDQDGHSGVGQDVSGALLVDIFRGSPADMAQLEGAHYQNRRSDGIAMEGGDVVIAIDGVRVKSASELASYMARSGRHVGDAATIRIVRGDQVFDVLVSLRARDNPLADQLGAI